IDESYFNAAKSRIEATTVPLTLPAGEEYVRFSDRKSRAEASASKLRGPKSTLWPQDGDS
ncbi:MAG: hypothetical protein M3P18_20045, partial [Actinomycetota bacterium]|nr:hypothetical protein [Actinomycetota bacterium]